MERINICAECGGTLEKKIITHTQPWGEQLYKFEDVTGSGGAFLEMLNDVGIKVDADADLAIPQFGFARLSQMATGGRHDPITFRKAKLRLNLLPSSRPKLPLFHKASPSVGLLCARE